MPVTTQLFYSQKPVKNLSQTHCILHSTDNCSMVLKPYGTYVFLLTHYESFLLSLHRALASGSIKPDRSHSWTNLKGN